MRTSQCVRRAERTTFTQLKRRDQLVACANDAIAELGSTTVSGTSPGGRTPAFDVRAEDVAIVERVLQLGQDMGRLGAFDARVMAALMKAAVDDLLTQFADDPELDLEAYAAELAALFERATRPDPDAPPGAST